MMRYKTAFPAAFALTLLSVATTPRCGLGLLYPSPRNDNDPDH